MSSPYKYAQRILSDADLGFIANGDIPTREGIIELRHSLAANEHVRADIFKDEHLFKRVVSLDDVFVRISPRLFFEVLLRRSIYEISHASHLLERSGADRVPLFLGDNEIRIFSEPTIIDYLADMLVSFTKIYSHTARVRVRRGVWRKFRYSDLDVPSLLSLAAETDGPEQQAHYKRAADASLLILGMFPDYAAGATRYPGTRMLRRRGSRFTTEQYEHAASTAYRLAGRHAKAHKADITPMLMLSESVIDAKRPLNYLADHYLQLRRGSLFGMRS